MSVPGRPSWLRPDPARGWRARLDLRFDVDLRSGATRQRRQEHEGPLRVLKSLREPGDPALQQVLVHPPGGLVGGDALEISLSLDAGAHVLATTPGATRLYRSDGPVATQTVRLRLAPGAVLEWLPLETIAYPGCRVRNKLVAELGDGARLIGRDVLALGLPVSGQPFRTGHVEQRIDVQGWLEQARIDGADDALLQGLAGWAGRSVLGSCWFACGGAASQDRIEALLDAARAVIDGAERTRAVRSGSAGGERRADPIAGATSPRPSIVVVRALGDRVEPVVALLDAVWAAWRPLALGCAAVRPRVWAT